MSEDKELLAKISQIAGHINRHKNQENSEMENTTAGPSSARRHHPYAHQYTNQAARSGPVWRPSLGARGRGRGGRVLPSAHRNRTLVLNTAGTPINSHEQTNIAPPTPSGDAMGGSVNGPYIGWISKIDRHKQLINPSIYETETSRRAKAIEKTRNMKAHRKDEREKTRIMRSLESMAVSGMVRDARSRLPDLAIDGLRFKPSPDGSKLTKIPGMALDASLWRPDLLLLDDVGSTQSTPKKVNALDGLYIRTKNGNLYRSGLVKSKQRKLRSQKINVLCKRFTTTGTLSPPPIHTHRSHRSSR
ncbi:MAG: hypothetical protein M1836_001439 [Candelina mexicana]|nr:MAG: hypothetical protein M1836_001439 [Candelina mexicana]